ncbi:MAG TPA: non-heme iron oxygenase ferredoxin subunit [Stellaceae bacterium]|nr:non-heme iron oxygenase ferredoxin subunit [Stellaceae bacterium]
MRFLCRLEELEPDSVKRVVTATGQVLAVYRLKDAFHASDDRCSHGQASLSEGMIEDGLIVCPLHYGAFDIATGEPAIPPCSVPLKVFPTAQRDGGLYLVDEDAAD